MPEQLSASELRLIDEITRLAADTTDLQGLFAGILDRSIAVVGGHRGFIAKVDFDSGQLVIHSGAGPDWNEEKLRQRLEWHAGDGKGITTYVAATGKPYRTGDVSKDPYYLRYFKDVVSEIAVPILDTQGRTRGVINVDSQKPDAFDDRHTDLLVLFARIASVGISMDEHRQREKALVEIGAELTGSRDISSLVKQVVKVTAEVLRFEDCSVFMIDKDRRYLTLEASRGLLNEEVGKAAYALGEGLTGWIAEHSQPIRTSDTRSDPRWRGLHREFPPDEMGAFLGVPIEGREGPVGVLRVLRRKSKFPWFKNDFTADDEGVLMSIASQVGAVVQSLRLMDRVVNAERMAAWGEMSARSAHMIGNRVFAIKGDLNELEYLLSQPDHSSDQLKELADGIRNGVFRLEEILMEFRDFVLATQLSLSDQDINQIVAQSVEEFFPKRSPIILDVTLTPDLPSIQADPSKLKRCFAELIENSVSFQENGGSISIVTGLGSPSDAMNICRLSGKRPYVRVEMVDSGPGVPEEIKGKIFTPFYSSRAKGMGLGLSIVKGIVEAHHGRICEIGSVGEGARFVIFLPADGEEDHS